MIWLNACKKPSPIRDLGERAEVKVRMGKISTSAQDQFFPQRVAEDFDLTDHTCFHSVLPVRVVWLGKVDHLLVSAGQSLLVTFPWAPRVPWQRNLQWGKTNTHARHHYWCNAIRYYKSNPPINIIWSSGAIFLTNFGRSFRSRFGSLLSVFDTFQCNLFFGADRKCDCCLCGK